MTDPTISTTVHLGDASRERALLSIPEKGIYWEVRFLIAGAGGRIPDDPERIRRAIGADREEWDRCWPAVERLFPVADGKRYHQGTLDNIEFREARRQAGRRGGQISHPPKQTASNPQAPGQANTQANGNLPYPLPLPLPDPSPADPDICPAAVASGRVRAGRGRDRSGESALFGRLWAAYPRHDARARAALEWARQVRDHGDEAALSDVVTAALRWQVPHWQAADHEFPSHVPYLSTYLHQKRWTDERPATARPPSLLAARPSPAPAAPLPPRVGLYALDAAEAETESTATAETAADAVKRLIGELGAAKGVAS